MWLPEKPRFDPIRCDRDDAEVQVPRSQGQELQAWSEDHWVPIILLQVIFNNWIYALIMCNLKNIGLVRVFSACKHHFYTWFQPSLICLNIFAFKKMATRPDSVGGWSFFSLFLYPCRQGPLKIKALGDSLNLVTLGKTPNLFFSCLHSWYDEYTLMFHR